MPGGKDAGSKAADAQVEGIEKGIEEQRRQYDLTRKDFLPQRGYGGMALRQLAVGEMGMPDLGPYKFDGDGNMTLAHLAAGDGAAGGAGGAGTGAPAAAPGQAVSSAVARGSNPWDQGPFSEQVIFDKIIEAGGGGEGANFTLWPDQMREINTAILAAPQAAPAPAPAAPVDDGTPQFGQPAMGGITSGFKESPGYQFQMDQGLEAIERSAAARGRRNSGATLKALQTFGTGLASQEYGNYYNRLAQLSGVGQTATQNLAQVGQNTANQIAGMRGDQGAARASGYVADQNARNSMFGNVVGLGAMAMGKWF